MDLLQIKGKYDIQIVKLRDIADKVSQKNSACLVSETFTNSAEKGIISQEDYFERTITNNKNISGYYIVNPDDFVYNPRVSTLAPVGPINRNKLGRTGVISPLYLVFRVHNVEPGYLEWYFKSNAWHNFMLENGNTGARSDRFSISDTEFFSMPIPLPPMNVQKMIANTLDTLEIKINYAKVEAEKLRNFKSSMLTKMFPKEGKKVPEIRFKGFSDDWEQRKLTEFVEFFSGLTYTPNDVQKNGTLVLRSSNVSNGEVVDADNVYVNPQVVNSENVKVGDIVVVVRNGSRSLIGKHAQIKAFMPNTVIGAFMTGIRSECPEFTNALLNTSRFEEEIAMNMGATINQITGYMFSKMEFKVPCLDEQKKIGSYFANLDRLITLHQRKYEKLLDVKKALLRKLIGGAN